MHCYFPFIFSWMGYLSINGPFSILEVLIVCNIFATMALHKHHKGKKQICQFQISIFCMIQRSEKGSLKLWINLQCLTYKVYKFPDPCTLHSQFSLFLLQNIQCCEILFCTSLSWNFRFPPFRFSGPLAFPSLFV